MTHNLGMFYGVGVGPGPEGFLPVAALEALRTCDVIFYPRATSKDSSSAMHCLRGMELPPIQFEEITFRMDPDRDVLREHYRSVAESIALPLTQQKNVGYLTLGDSFTYSTYGYIIAALKEALPGLRHQTFPGITSYAAVAALSGWSLGEGKERVLILPCPDDMEALRQDIQTHDIVILMKIGKRLSQVMTLLQEMGIARHCVFARRIGFEDQVFSSDITSLSAEESMGYLATMLIRQHPREVRHL